MQYIYIILLKEWRWLAEGEKKREEKRANTLIHKLRFITYYIFVNNERHLAKVRNK